MNGGRSALYAAALFVPVVACEDQGGGPDRDPNGSPTVEAMEVACERFARRPLECRDKAYDVTPDPQERQEYVDEVCERYVRRGSGDDVDCNNFMYEYFDCIGSAVCTESFSAGNTDVCPYHYDLMLEACYGF